MNRLLVTRLLGTALLAACLALPVAHAYSLRDSYIPPEITYADDLSQRIHLPHQVDINRAGLNDLKVLPGFDEELALKVLRNRPFEGIQDFYKKLPGLESKQIDRLIRQFQPKVLFK